MSAREELRALVARDHSEWCMSMDCECDGPAEREADALYARIRAAALREAADVADEIGGDLVRQALPSSGRGAYDVMEELRRMAQEEEEQ